MNHSVGLRTYAEFVVNNRRPVLAAILIISLFLGFGITKLYVEVDPDRELPQDHPYVQAFHEAHRLFGEKNLIVIGLLPVNGDAFTPAFLRQVKFITDQLATLPGAVLPLLHSVASPATKDVVVQPDGLSVRPLMPDAPLSTAAALTIKQRLFDDPSFIGTLVSYDGSALAIYATFELTPELPGYVNLHRAVVDILRAADDGTFAYLLSGPVVIVASLSTYASQVAYFFPIALVVIGLIHYQSFRTWQAVFLPLSTGLLAVAWALGLMGHLGVPLDPFNSTTPVLILAIGAGHAVQILKRYYEEFGRLGDNNAAIVESISRVGGVMIAAASIAALSFLSLSTLGTESMRTFGIFTAFGICSVLVIELTTIPALRAMLRPPRHDDWANGDIHTRLGRLLEFAGNRLSSMKVSKLVLALYAAIIAISLLLAQRIEVDTSFKRNFKQSDPIRAQDDTLNALFAGTNVLLFTIEGPAVGSIAEPATLRGIDAFERRLQLLPGVGKANSIVGTLKRLHRALRGSEDLNDLPDRKDLVTQYLFLYALSGGTELATRITPDNRKAKVVVLLHEDSTQYGNTIIAEARKIAHEELPSNYKLHVAGTLASNSALTEAMVKGKLLNVIQIGAITIAVAAVILRSCLAALLVAIPLAIAVLINFGVMGALDIRLDVATAAVTAMAVGIGADYAVYFLFRLREEYGASGDFASALTRCLTTSGRAILLVSSAVGIGYSVLCLSGFRLFVQLGSLVGLAMITSSLATLLVLPSLLTLISRTRWIHSVLGNARPPDI